MLRIIPRAFSRLIYVNKTAQSVRASVFSKKISHRFALIAKYISTEVSHAEANKDSSNIWGDVVVEEVTEGDPELEKLLKVLILEVDVFRQDGHLVPDNISSDEWRELLTLHSRASRLRYLKFLFKVERKKENRILKSAEKARAREEQYKEADESGHITYGFRGSTIFLRIYDSTMDSYLNKNLINAAMFSQHIVFDCSYDAHMSNMEARNCAKQICMLFAENRNHVQPFHLQFCNIDPTSTCMQSLRRYIPTMYDESFPFFTTTKSYLDLYPKEKLVYLTPHCREDLIEYNHDDVYIVGAMVDKNNPKPLSLAKAKEEGLRMARLPLEKHLVWGSGSTKNLTLNQMVSILLDVRTTGDWKYAFKHIPQRKLAREEDILAEKTIGMRKMRPAIKALTRDRDISLSHNIISKLTRKKSNKFDD